jgi:hypothetical protein
MNLVNGTLSTLVLLFFVWGALLFYTERARRGKVNEIKMIPALNAIEEAVGRAAEMGGKVMYVNGTGNLTSQTGPETIAGMAVLQYLSEIAAKKDVDVIAPLTQPQVMPVASEAMKSGYTAGGNLQRFKEDNIRYVSSSQWGLASSCMGMMIREKVVSNVMVGSFAGEALAIVSAGAEAGIFQIGGCGSNTTQMPWFVAMCDYALIGEEVYAAGAYLSKDPKRIGSLIGQDMSKMVVIVLIMIGFILYFFNSKALINLLKM